VRSPVSSKSIANTVREARQKARLTQADLASLAGIHQPNLSRIEAATFAPRLDTLQRLADAMGYALEVRFVPRSRRKEPRPC